MESNGVEWALSEAAADDKLVGLYFKDNVFYLVMKRNDNRINREFINQFEQALDSVTLNYGDLTGCSLVTLSTHPKVFCNGGDVHSFADEDQLKEFLNDAARVLAKLLALPLPTIALVNGHAFGLGAYMII